jgi:hypothetical protein
LEEDNQKIWKRNSELEALIEKLKQYGKRMQRAYRE